MHGLTKQKTMLIIEAVFLYPVQSGERKDGYGRGYRRRDGLSDASQSDREKGIADGLFLKNLQLPKVGSWGKISELGEICCSCLSIHLT